jgi:DNA-binding PadR family transcriptional regulator
MTIQFALLGLLSWKSLTGYELKKMLASSDLYYWSGNNNQIYTTLLYLLKNNLVTQEIIAQENSPAKKIYTITQKGLEELKKWILSSPEAPNLRSTFLIQLAWADQVNQDDLSKLIDNYEEEIQNCLVLQKEKAKRMTDSPNRTDREIYLWKMISLNFANFYENELLWVSQLKRGLGKL